MVDTSNKPYPMQFDPSQFSNPYSQYATGALPWPSQYAGTPTDAMGNPIVPPTGSPGLSLASIPAAAPAQNTPNIPALAHLMASQSGPAGAYSWGNNQQGYYNPPNAAQLQRQLSKIFGQQGTGQTPATGAAVNPSQNYDLNSALSLLANPGKVTTPGMSVQPDISGAAGQSGLNAFMSSFGGGGNTMTAPPGIGGGSPGVNMGANSTFLNTLNQLKPSWSSGS